MAKVASRGVKLSNVLSWEMAPEEGFSRSAVTVTKEVGMDVGAVVVLNAGKYKWVAAADVATLGSDVRIVIDPAFFSASVGDVTGIAVLGNELTFSPAMVTRAGLLFKDVLTSGQIDTVVTKLNARGIRTTTRI